MKLSQAEKDKYHMVSLLCGTEGIARRTLGEEGKSERGGMRGADEP